MNRTPFVELTIGWSREECSNGKSGKFPHGWLSM